LRGSSGQIMLGSFVSIFFPDVTRPAPVHLFRVAIGETCGVLAGSAADPGE
jgi:hypothetical protein